MQNINDPQPLQTDSFEQMSGEVPAQTPVPTRVQGPIHTESFADNIEEAIENEDQELAAEEEAEEEAKAKKLEKHHLIHQIGNASESLVHKCIDEVQSCCKKVNEAFHHHKQDHATKA